LCAERERLTLAFSAAVEADSKFARAIQDAESQRDLEKALDGAGCQGDSKANPRRHGPSWGEPRLRSGFQTALRGEGDADRTLVTEAWARTLAL
jgi:hypothetical protein